ncbi:MAG TPA: hypothetical protein VMH85_10645, partial [Terriglobales bacterium]|nr:hypothetical protein [Terriglobales bacterium]
MFVFDASSLILITKAEILDLFLADIGVQVAIPGEVAKESCGAKQSFDSLMIQKALDESRIKVIAVKNRKMVERLVADLGLGLG